MAQKNEQLENNEGVGYEAEIYTRRFSQSQDTTREVTWKILCKDFLSKYVGQQDTVIDIGAGDGLFVRNIVAAKKIAVDLSDHVQNLTNHGVEVIQAPATQFVDRLSGKADAVFMSNFLEHLPEKRLVLEVLRECHKALKPGGKVIILQPNIRYVGPAYWDYIDHHIALTEHSLVEALEVTGYRIQKLIPRFLPYTAKSTLGSLVNGDKFSALISAYLKLPLLWRFFGQQTFVVAEKQK